MSCAIFFMMNDHCQESRGKSFRLSFIGYRLLNLRALPLTPRCLFTTTRFASVASGNLLPFVGPQPHSVATLKAPVALPKEVLSPLLRGGSKAGIPSPPSVANGDSLPYVGPQPHSVAALKTPVPPHGGRLKMVARKPSPTGERLPVLVKSILNFITASLQSRWFWREACDGSLFTKAGNSPKTRGKYFPRCEKMFP